MSEHIRDRCPSCGSSGSLFIGTGGYLTCGLIGCPEPGVGRAIANLQAHIEALETALRMLSYSPDGLPDTWPSKETVDTALAAEKKPYPADAGCTRHIGEPWPCPKCQP